MLTFCICFAIVVGIMLAVIKTVKELRQAVQRQRGHDMDTAGESGCLSYNDSIRANAEADFVNIPKRE